MTQPTPTNPLTKWIGDNLLTLVLGGAVVYSGFTSSDAVTNQRLNDIDRRLAEIKQSQDAILVYEEDHRQRADCRTRTIERLADRAGVAPACPM